MDLLAGVAAAVVPYFRNWLTSAALVGAALAPQALLAQALLAQAVMAQAVMPQQSEPQVRVLLVESPTLTVGRPTIP